MHRVTAAMVFGAIVAIAIPARAQESDHDRAVALFTESRRLIEAGDCAGAMPKLQESLAREPSIGARFSLAECTRDADPYGAFWHVREAALLAFVKHDDRLASAEEQSEALVKRVGGVRFDIDAVDLRAPGFDLRIDGEPVDRFHLSSPIAPAPGDHRVVASVADGRSYEDSVRVTLGSVALARVVLGRRPRADAPPPGSLSVVPRDEGGGLSGRRKVALVVGGAGLATLSLATAFGIVALEKRSELDRACNGDRDACTGPPRIVDPVLDSADSNATVSTILFVVGGALLAGGTVLWLTGSKTSPARNAAVLRW